MSWYNDAGHVLVVGRTQTGKTSAIREVHAANGRMSIWLNETGDDRVEGVAGDRVRSLDGLQSSMASDSMAVNWLSRDRKADVQTLKDYLWSVSKAADRKLPMQLVIDECHRLAPQSQKPYGNLPGRDAVRDLMKEGMKRNVKVILITQDPVAADPRCRRQREYLLAFPYSTEHQSTMSDYGASLQDLRQLDEYSGRVYHADGTVTEPEVRARSKYSY